jgi:hypothetical protein
MPARAFAPVAAEPGGDQSSCNVDGGSLDETLSDRPAPADPCRKPVTHRALPDWAAEDRFSYDELRQRGNGCVISGPPSGGSVQSTQSDVGARSCLAKNELIAFRDRFARTVQIRGSTGTSNSKQSNQHNSYLN